MAKLVHCLGILAAFSQGVVAIADYSMDTRCGYSNHFMSTSQIRLRLTNDYQYDNNMICNLNLHTTGGYNLLVHFVRMEIEYKLDCGFDFLTIYDGSSMSSPILTSDNRLCGSMIPRDYTSSGNDLTFYFQSDAYTQLSGFEVIITPFLQPGECDASWMYKFICENGRCISSRMTCSGYNPCGDYSDCPERSSRATATPATPAPITHTYYDPCSLSDCSMHSVSVGATILIVVGVIVVLVIVVIGGVLLRRRRRAPVQRNQTMGVATIPLPTTNMYAPPPPYAQVAHLGSQQSLQQNNTQPPPYTAMAPAMGRPNEILFPPDTGAALSQSTATPLPVSDTTQNSKAH